MSGKKIRILYAIVDRYEKDGKLKNKYKKVGVEVTKRDEDGKEFSYLLIDRDVNFAGFPDFSGKQYTTSVLVSKFDLLKTNDEAVYLEGEVY